MTIRKPGHWVLWCECIAFGLILLVLWLDEVTGLSHVLFGGQTRATDWREVIFETGMVVVISGVVLVLTNRLLARLHYLERFLRVCAWCRKIGYRDEWMPVEDYFKQGFHIETTHGMCPECLRKLEEDTKEFRKKDVMTASGKTPSPAVVHGQS